MYVNHSKLLVTCVVSKIQMLPAAQSIDIPTESAYKRVIYMNWELDNYTHKWLQVIDWGTFF